MAKALRKARVANHFAASDERATWMDTLAPHQYRCLYDFRMRFANTDDAVFHTDQIAEWGRVFGVNARRLLRR